MTFSAALTMYIYIKKNETTPKKLVRDGSIDCIFEWKFSSFCHSSKWHLNTIPHIFFPYFFFRQIKTKNYYTKHPIYKMIWLLAINIRLCLILFTILTIQLWAFMLLSQVFYVRVFSDKISVFFFFHKTYNANIYIDTGVFVGETK